MASALRVLLVLLTIGCCTEASAEILVRWDQEDIPSPQSLGISSVVIPADKPAAVRSALARGYRVYAEIESAGLAGFERAEGVAGAVVRGPVPPAQLAALEQKLRPGGVRVLEERSKWPHIRTNWVTRNKDVLQVTSRSSQPWIENNEALIRIAAAGGGGRILLSYPWKPVTVADLDQGPRAENYLVAIAEAGSFGADLLLPLHERFQRSLILGRPEARAEWNELRRYIEFYSWDVPIGYTPVANVGVVAADPMRSFELMNLLGRHNLPFTPIDPARLAAPPAGLDLLIVLDAVQGTALQQVAAFAASGGTVLWAAASSTPAATPPERLPWQGDPNPVAGDARVTYASGRGRVIEWRAPLGNPNTFALDMRQVLGPERRVIDIWNGITVLTAPYAAPAGGGVVVTAVNYAAQPLPVQLRVRGIFSQVQYESPEEPAALLSFQHRNGFTEFVLPALRIGGRVFLTPLP